MTVAEPFQARRDRLDSLQSLSCVIRIDKRRDILKSNRTSEPSKTDTIKNSFSEGGINFDQCCFSLFLHLVVSNVTGHNTRVILRLEKEGRQL